MSEEPSYAPYSRGLAPVYEDDSYLRYANAYDTEEEGLSYYPGSVIQLEGEGAP